MLQLECEAILDGRSAVAGVDEAGRGPLAGPIVAAAVMLSGPVTGVDDSKRLTEKKREAFFAELTKGSHAVGIEIISAEAIDKMGIQNANYGAMARAAEKLAPAADFLLVDGFRIPGCAIPLRRVIKGDQLSQSIAAASVVAKVTRDRIMRELDTRYPEYGFAAHKGYGTRRHLEALERHGASPVHRKSFAPVAAVPANEVLFSEKELHL